MVPKLTWQLKTGLIVAACLILIKFGLIPLYDWRSQIMLDISRFREAIAVKKTLVGKRDRLQGTLQEAKTAHETVTKFYHKGFSDPESLQLALQKEIEAISSTAGLSIRSKEWLPSSSGELVQVPIRLMCQAPIDDIIRFIAAVETYERFLTIDRLRIFCRPNKDTVSAEFNISAYGIRDRS